MKSFIHSTLVVPLLLLLLLPLVAPARRISRSHTHHRHHHRHSHHHPTRQERIKVGLVKAEWYDGMGKEAKMVRKPDTVQIAGSSLPDCSHACGGCSPCRLVMVSFLCATLEEAETCPMAYKCMCKSKSYPVP